MHFLKFWVVMGTVLGVWSAIASRTIAQTVPISDGTTGSVVVPGGVTLINGGTQRGSALFHSFSDFSVGVSDRVYFSNPVGVTDILSRVTGANPSNIFGTLGVNGSANLFLINPRGIVFGKDAKLDIAGGFVASTADRLILNDGSSYQVTNPNDPLLLQVNVKPGLQTGVNYVGTIVNQGGKLGSVDQPTGTIGVGKDISLLARQIDLQPGSVVQAIGNVLLQASEKIQITGTPQNPSFVQSLVDATVAGGDVTLISPDISMTGQAFVRTDVLPDATGQGGDITIQTQNLNGSRGAEILARTVGNGDAGSISITPLDPTQVSNVQFDGVADFLKVDDKTGFPEGGYSSGIIISTEDAPGETPATGKGGFLYINGITNVSLSNGAVISGRSRSSGNGANVALDIKNLSLTEGAQINVSAYKSGDPGNIVVNAETVTISGKDLGYQLRFDKIEAAVLAWLKAQPNPVNNPPKEARERTLFTVDPAGPVSALSTSIFKSGRSTSDSAGFILVNASKSINLAREAEISSSSFGQSDAGLILLTTGKTYSNVLELLNATINANRSDDVNQWFALGNGGRITLDDANIFSTIERGAKGDAGRIYITTGSLLLQNSAQIQTIVRGAKDGISGGGEGNAGLIGIQATESVRLTGFIDKVQNGKLQRFGSGLLSSVGAGAIGDRSGIIAIRTPLIYLNDNAYITTSNFSDQGQAGYIIANTNFIVLDRNSRLTSVSASGRGGNIGLKSAYLVGVSRGSRITTAAGSDKGGGTGGNIAIGPDLTFDSQDRVILNSNLQTLLTYGFPYKDTDIVANAFDGPGGRIDLSTLALRNLAKRKDTPISDDLDASSNQVGLNGTVNINTFNLDVDRGLQPMSDRFRDYVLSEGCDPRTRQEANSLKQVGTGLVAQDATQQLERRTTIAALPTTSPTDSITPRAETQIPIAANPNALIPAQGWTQTPDGKLQFIAASLPTSLTHSGIPQTQLCPANGL